jgi:transcriptional regulator with XRE-family HTH domain
MLIGNRWRELRKETSLSLNDLATRAGLLVRDLSAIERGRIIPSKETLEKFASYLKVPASSLFYDGENPPGLLTPPKRKADSAGRGYRKGNRELTRLRILFSPVDKSP